MWMNRANREDGQIFAWNINIWECLNWHFHSMVYNLTVTYAILNAPKRTNFYGLTLLPENAILNFYVKMYIKICVSIFKLVVAKCRECASWLLSYYAVGLGRSFNTEVTFDVIQGCYRTCCSVSPEASVKILFLITELNNWYSSTSYIETASRFKK
jgi:hypothetical protein